MEQLIKITTNEKNEQVVSARELHNFLEAGSTVTTWFKNQSERAMLSENEDFICLQISESKQKGGHNKIDYAIKLSAAKEIAMLNGGEKGKQARAYFLECEKIAQSKQSVKLPTTYLEALKELVAKEEEIILLQEKNEKLQFRSDFVDVCFDTNSLFSMEEASKILKLPYGRNKMMEKLRTNGVLLSSNTPKQKYISNGYFKVVETLIQNGEFKKLVSTTYVSQKGIGFIHKLLIEKQ